MSEVLKDKIGPQKQFHEFLAEGKFKIQRSKVSGEFFFHPRVAFPGTGDRDLEWVEVKGTGIVHTTGCNRRLPEKGGDFNLSIIELDEGPMMMASVFGVEPDKVEIGDKVKARIVELQGEPNVVFDLIKD